MTNNTNNNESNNIIDTSEELQHSAYTTIANKHCNIQHRSDYTRNYCTNTEKWQTLDKKKLLTVISMQKNNVKPRDMKISTIQQEIVITVTKTETSGTMQFS